MFHDFENVQKCDLCGSQDLHELRGGNDIVECNNCHFVFTSPRPTFSEIEKSYSNNDFYLDWVNEDDGRQKLWRKRYKRISPFLKEDISLLDYSAGIGTFLYFAKKDGIRVFGTEISKSAKAIALKNYEIVLENENALLSEKKNKFYDVITGWHVVEHVESPSNLLSNFHRCMKEDGILVVAVPNNQHRTLKQILTFKSMDLKLLYPKLEPGGEIHLSHFNEGTMRKLLKKTGFEVLVLGIDDHFANPNFRNRIKYMSYVLIRKFFGKNFSETLFVIARKSANNI